MHWKRKALFLKVSGWISLAINVFICAVIVSISISEYVFIAIGAIGVLGIAIYAFLKLRRDKRLDDLSVSSVIVLHIGVLIVSLVLCYYMYAYVSVLALGVLSCIIVLEVLATGFLWRKK